MTRTGARGDQGDGLLAGIAEENPVGVGRVALDVLHRIEQGRIGKVAHFLKEGEGGGNRTCSRCPAGVGEKGEWSFKCGER